MLNTSEFPNDAVESSLSDVLETQGDHLKKYSLSQKALNYSDAFRQQCQPLATLMTGDLRVTLHIFYASRRPDLDESLILDLMQGLIYENDRQVKERHAYWGLDPENPRAEILVEKIESVAPIKKPQRKGRG